jgi:hypothetical protein
MFVEDENQRDWDAYAKRLTFTINTVHDRIQCLSGPWVGSTNDFGSNVAFRQHQAL